jgi:hypothetical protein
MVVAPSKPVEAAFITQFLVLKFCNLAMALAQAVPEVVVVVVAMVATAVAA